MEALSGNKRAPPRVWLAAASLQLDREATRAEKKPRAGLNE
jgi:hypothetical protein